MPHRLTTLPPRRPLPPRRRLPAPPRAPPPLPAPLPWFRYVVAAIDSIALINIPHFFFCCWSVLAMEEIHFNEMKF